MASLVALVAASVAGALPTGIVIHPQATQADVFAAEDLSTYLTKISGGAPAFAICNYTDPCYVPSASWWVVGSRAALAVGVPSAALDGLGLEGFVVQSVGQHGSFAVTGGTNILGRGTIYAVNHVLRALGVEFFAHDVTQLPASLPITAPSGLEARVIPALEYRQQYEWQCLTDDANESFSKFESHLGLNRGSTPLGSDPKYGGVVIYGPPGFVHTSYAVLTYPKPGPMAPPPDLWAAHREWFWPATDDGAKTYGQICWSNTSLQQFLIKQVKQIIKDNPTATIISVSQNDNGAYCQTPEELAIIKEEGTPGGALFRAINVIADAVKDEYPDVAIDTLAYQWSRPAPSITIPRSNVIIRLCSIECNFGAPLNDPSNAPFQTDINNWSKISNRTFIWNYITNFGQYLGPFPDWWVIGANVKYYKEHGVSGIFQEGAYSGPGGDMNELKDFVLSRMMWDPTLNDSALIDQFLQGYYGDAAPHIKTYMTTMHASVQATKYIMHENFDSVHAPFMTPDVVLTAATAFGEALKMDIPADVANRVLSSSMAIYWVVMPRWGELMAYASAHGITWPLEKTLPEAFDTTFARAYNVTAARYGSVPAFREGGTMTLAEYRKTLIGSCPEGWTDMPCSPVCPSGAAALQYYPASVKASSSWPNGTEPTLTGQWNSGGFPPAWIEFEINATSGKFAGLVATVGMEPGGQATHVVSVDGADVVTWSSVMAAGELLRWKGTNPVAASKVRITTTTDPSWVSWEGVSLYFC